MGNKSGFILLPGGGMSSWVWRDLIPLLKKQALPVDYRLPANNLATRQSATIRDCAAHVINLAEKQGLENIILVGHSGAGIIAAQVAKTIPEKIRHVVYISANIPENHTSALDSLPFFVKILNKTVIRSMVKKNSSPAKKMEKIIRSKFCNASPEEIIQYILAQDLLSEPLCVAFEKINRDNFPDVKQTFILLLKDNTQTVDQQKKMMQHLSIKDSIEIESDHMVMLSRPKELADVLNRFI